MLSEREFRFLRKIQALVRGERYPIFGDGSSIKDKLILFKDSSVLQGCDMLLLDPCHRCQQLQGKMPVYRIKSLLGDKLQIDGRIALLTILSTLLIMVDYYFSPTGFNHIDSILLYILIPGFCILVVFREPLSEYGFKLGDWKAGLAITVMGCLLMAPVIWVLGTRNASMQGYYQYRAEGLVWRKGLEMFGWEFIFRGWLLFGYAKKFGPDALWIQAVPFAVAHIGKPMLETLTTVFGGFAFGWVAWRTGSFLYGFLIHWFIGALIVLVSSGAFS